MTIRRHTQAANLCTRYLELPHNLSNRGRRVRLAGDQGVEQWVEEPAARVGCSMDANLIDGHGHGRLVHHLHRSQQASLVTRLLGIAPAALSGAPWLRPAHV